MEKDFDFPAFNTTLIQKNCSNDLIAAFDPTFIPKSGTHTPGLGKWWSGKDQKALKGLEVGCLAIIDVKKHTAMSLKAEQTPGKMELAEKGIKLIAHYVDIIRSEITTLKNMVKYLAVDGYFMKKDFINPIFELGLHIITKMRPDANLSYVYYGAQKPGPGRPRTHGEKVNCAQIDKRRIREFAVDNDAVYYSGIVWSAILKKKIRIVFIEKKGTDQYEILMSTDTKLNPKLILKYYRLRFQIEFLIRDAKQHTGLEECQARSKNKLYFHFNMAFTTIGIAKCALWLKHQEKTAFSMRNVKVAWYNRYLRTCLKFQTTHFRSILMKATWMNATDDSGSLS
ncbi:hypothetical protein BW716_35040 [[Flexibacter] sp. ATCC 35208]|nr:hypothetical protein BW716_35040 [[Flexibacter] sp. ATCC 35208]